jgi:tRNA-2-methylthio-N6-dimethylallyladenosine synthase
MKYYILTFGCQMNESDSEKIVAILEQINYKPVHRIEQADLIIVNACSVRQSAIDRIYGQNRYFSKLKTNKQKLITILTGCVLEKDKKKLSKQFDYIINIKDIEKISDLLNPKIRLSKNLKDYFHIKPKYSSKIEAYMPIMTGCNNFCSYCVVPYVRDQEISRPINEIINEVSCLVKNGYKKITLLGQNVNSYNSKFKVKSSKLKLKNKSIKTKDFIELIEKIDNIPGKFWFNFITNHPKDMSNELINILPKLEKFCHYIHLPIQSGDNKILKKMNRHYTTSHYLSLIKKIRKVLLDAAISTDVIVGFPDETKNQFEATKKLMKEVKFDMAYISCYSPRPQTIASKLSDNITEAEKNQRKDILNQILTKTALENNKKYINKEIEILVKEKNKKKNNIFCGETKTLKSVEMASNKNLIGQFVKVKITKVTPWAMHGELL